MLGDYSSFLEFTAGIYATICFDDVLNNVWSSRYYSNTSKVFDEIKVEYYPNLSNELKQKNKEWVDALKKPMIRRASFMLLMLLTLLCFVGFEEEWKCTNLSFPQIHLSLICDVIFILIAYFVVFRKLVFCNWWWFCFSVVLLLPVSYVMYLYCGDKEEMFIYSEKYFCAIVVVFVLIPIAWQLFSSWVYSYLYTNHIKLKIPKALSDYQIAIGLSDKKDKSKLPSKYREVFFDTALVGDTCVDKFNECLIEELMSFSRPTNVFRILKSSILFAFQSIFKRERRPQVKNVGVDSEAEDMKRVSVPSEYKNVVHVELDYSVQYEEYRKQKKQNKKLNLTTFCKNNNINFTEFKMWLEKANPKRG